MNPERNRGGMTVNALMQLELFTSIGIPVVLLALLSWLSTSLDHFSLMIAVLICAVVVLLSVMVIHYIIQGRVRDRVQQLTEVCRDYTSGDRTARAVVNGGDDFAFLAISINTLLDNQNNAAPQSSLGVGSGSDAAALQAQIEKLLQEVSAVGDGDLRVQAEVTPDTLGVLADSFNYMIEELAKVVGRVQSTAVQVTNATRRILDGSAELAQASETQVAQISQTTEAVEALAIFIQNVARNAQLSAEMAQEALRNAANGQQSVRQTIEGMMLIRENVQETSKKIKRLGERSNEIGEIVRIIEDIADQTNLLALNAAIQSAMAGEHGRGFAVVADEIRLLAERSTESTKRIATLVKSIQGDTYEAVVAMENSTQEVVKGSQLADEAGRALNSIYGAVERQAQMIENIARAANEQTTVSEAVAVTMGRISEITRQTDAGTQEAAVSVSYLAELSEQLRASVSTFRLPERNNEMLGAFPNVPSGEMSNNNSEMFTPSMLQNMDSDWESHDYSGNSFAGNFPPLPEPGNSGSLVALSSARPSGNQFAFNNQQDFGNGNFGSQQPFGNPANNASQESFSSRQQPFSGQQYGNGNSQPFGASEFENNYGFGNQFGNQQDFGDNNGFDNQMNFGGNGRPQFGGGMSSFNIQNQPPFPNRNQPPASNSNLLPPPGQLDQSAPIRPRWQQGGAAPNSQNFQNQQNQSQLLFNQDQTPFPNNG
ncbi:MAG: HAMP domain-containing protein [Ktedonobacteraceae bacterium]|nr:HAMP domain-containing protein [Ktedonobacteraceae bacterium]